MNESFEFKLTSGYDKEIILKNNEDNDLIFEIITHKNNVEMVLSEEELIQLISLLNRCKEII